MFVKLVSHEFKALGKTPVFWVLSMVFLGFGFIIGSQNNTPPNIFLNSGYQVAYNTGLFTLGSVFIIMFMAVASFLKDQKYGMESIVFSTIIPKHRYLLSKFISVCIASILVFMPFFAGHVLGIVLLPHDPSRLMPVHASTYVIPAVFLAMVNILICTSLISAVALFTRNHLATYVSAVAIYALYFICAIFLNSPIMASAVPATPGQVLFSSLGDPFGISAFVEQTRYWTPFEKNNTPLQLTGLFFWNRILWLTASLGIFFVSYAWFRLTPAAAKTRKTISVPAETVTGFRSVPTATGLFAEVLAFFSSVKSDFRGMLKDLPFIAMFIIWLVVVFTEIYTRLFDGGSYGESRYPETFILIELLTDPLRYFCLLPLIFYSGELVWRDRQVNFHPLVNATRISNRSLFLSKLLVLLSVPVLFILAAEMIAVGFQLATGNSVGAYGQYLSAFYFHGMPLYFVAVLAIFLQTVSRNKFLAMAITILAVLLSRTAGMFGVAHPLLNPFSMPYIEFSGMSGISASAALFNDQALILTGISVALITLALRWPGAIGRIPQHRGNGWRVALVASAILVLAAGIRVYYHMNVASVYLTRSEELDRREDYERSYKKYASLPVFFPDSIHTELDIYPDRRSFSVTTTQVLSNRSTVAADTLFITARLPLDTLYVENAQLIHHDPVQDTYLFHFPRPVAPGEPVAFMYALRHTPGRYDNDRAVVENGSYISQQEFEPFMGYRTSMEILDPYERAQRGLSPIDRQARDQHLEWRNSLGGPVGFSAAVSTTTEQVALTSGTLRRSWTDGDRNYYHYESTAPMLPVAGYFSARYDSLTGFAGGIRTEQYFQHAANAAHVQTYVSRTLEYCTAEFGPYPFDMLRLAEVPSHWQFGGFAHPGMISMVEDNLYLINPDEGGTFDLVAKRTIHEVAHQWWGHALMPKPAKGAGVLVEGLAKYTEAALLEKYLGKQALFILGRNAAQTYFTGRTAATEDEPPLATMDGQGYLSYGKSYLVLAGLRDLIGDEEINAALRSVLMKQSGRSITIEDFLSEIIKRTPARYHQLITDWFRRVIRYDLSVREVTVRQLEQGDWELSISLRARRFETQGSETPIGINEPIPVGLFSAHPAHLASDSEILDYRLVHVDQEAAVVTIRTKTLPAYVSIDPFGTRTDNDLYDNTREVKQ